MNENLGPPLTFSRSFSKGAGALPKVKYLVLLLDKVNLVWYWPEHFSSSEIALALVYELIRCLVQ